VKPTNAQRQLIGWLIDESAGEPKRLKERWGRGAANARRRAAEGQLLLSQDLTQDCVLTRDGVVVVIDTEDGSPPRPATDEEARTALFRSIAHYPELLSLLPPRPPDAVVCTACGGTGVWPVRFQKAEYRGIVCPCGGAGWTVSTEHRSARDE
jgi:hypothetical protein